MIRFIFIAIFFSSLFSSCSSNNSKPSDLSKKNKENSRTSGSEIPDSVKSKLHYFSIQQFLDDQWKLLNGQPILMSKMTTENGKTDSVNIPLDSSSWQNIYTTIIPSDISNSKYIGQYQFSTFFDTSNHFKVMIYEAINPDLYTRLLQIFLDPTNNKIISVFEKRKMLL